MTNVIVRYVSKGEKFEMIVDSELAWEYRLGKRTSLENILISDTIYKDANKGERATVASLQKVFGTTDVMKIADIIIKKGDLPITAERRNRLIEENRKKIINIITRNCIDTRTNAPLPPSRVENILKELKVRIDPFASAEEQATEIIKEIKKVIPIKIAKAIIQIQIPVEYASKTYNQIIAKMSTVVNSNWKNDGSWEGEVEIPAGIQETFIQKINEISNRKAIIKNIKII
ncbi:MAG: ribosome assembly factor SBDS [Thermoproteota archaeon]|nr:ribosome assembly factor SBDS [Thermoproteota archaeon]